MNRKSFTMLEVIIVVILMGVIAAFAIPSYNKAIEKQRYRNAKLNLSTIYTASRIFKAKNQDYPLMDLNTLTAINNYFALSISDPNFVYSWSSQSEGGDYFYAWANKPDGSYYVIITDKTSVDYQDGVACCGSSWPCPDGTTVGDCN